MTVAETQYGKVRGAEIADGVVGLAGHPVRAAADRRPPVPAAGAAEPWSGVRDALEHGNRSPQAEQEPPARTRGRPTRTASTST